MYDACFLLNTKLNSFSATFTLQRVMPNSDFVVVVNYNLLIYLFTLKKQKTNETSNVSDTCPWYDTDAHKTQSRVMCTKKKKRNVMWCSVYGSKWSSSHFAKVARREEVYWITTVTTKVHFMLPVSNGIKIEQCQPSLKHSLQPARANIAFVMIYTCRPSVF